MIYDNHTNQRNFRQLLDGFSFPLKEIKLENECFSALINVLIDHNVSVSTNFDKSILQYFEINNVVSNEADYLIYKGQVDYKMLSDVKVGSLVDPHESATLIVECSEEKTVVASGPGINGKKEVTILIDQALIDFRNEKNVEFPCGIDIIIVNNNKIRVIPRTTILEVK